MPRPFACMRLKTVERLCQQTRNKMNSSDTQQLNKLLASMEPISLEQMKSIRLMKRTDQKYVTTVSRLLDLLKLTREDYYVQEIAEKRIASYRTVYWDNPQGHPFFQNHQRGALPRTKVRARTYVDSNLSFLEIKKKNNHGKTSKKRITVSNIDSVCRGEEGAFFVQEQTGLDLGDLCPSVGNRFHRVTLVNKGRTERLTIDFDLQFDNFETGRQAALDDIVVVELKRDGRVYSPILAMLRQLRIKPSGFSKYCMGMCYTGDGLRINRFKVRLTRVKKICQRATYVKLSDNKEI